MSTVELNKLIHIGFTNECQIDYAMEDQGYFYSNSDDGCNIPLYMLDSHFMRATNSVVVNSHNEMKERIGELESLLKFTKDALFNDQFVVDTVWFDEITTLHDKIELTLDGGKQ